MPKIPAQILALAREHDARLRALNDSALLLLSRRLAAVRPALVEASQRSGFTGDRARAALLLADLGVEIARNALEPLFASVILHGMIYGHLDAIGEIGAWYDLSGAALQPFNLSAVVRIETALHLEAFDRSLERYGETVRGRLRAALSEGIIAFESRDALVDGVAQIIRGEQWQAERLVRTELAAAYNGTLHNTLVAARDTGVAADLKKSAVVTRDSRTAPDSFPLEGQVRDLEELFVDGAGRRYLHPPGRPNDREKEIPYLDDPDPDATRDAAVEYLPGARPAVEFAARASNALQTEREARASAPVSPVATSRGLREQLDLFDLLDNP